MKTMILSLPMFLMIGCGALQSTDSSGSQSKPSAPVALTGDVEGEFNGNHWQYLDGRAYTITYQNKKMLSIQLKPYKYVNPLPDGDWGKCYYGTPASVTDYFEISLRIPAALGSSIGGPGGIGDGILNNVHEVRGTKIIGHLGQGKVTVEAITSTNVSGSLDINYKDAESSAMGHASGRFDIMYCGEIGGG